MGKLQEILIRKRKDLNLSLREAGNLIGISHSYLSTLEISIVSYYVFVSFLVCYVSKMFASGDIKRAANRSGGNKKEGLIAPRSFLHFHFLPLIVSP